MAQRLIAGQTDFGGGQVDEDANRRNSEHKIPKTGARVMSNWRMRDTGALIDRPGRNAIRPVAGPRVERFRMSATQELVIIFATGAIAIRDLAGNTIGINADAAYLWTNTTAWQINWCATPDRLVFCFPGMRPQIAKWNAGTNAFTFEAFTFQTIGSDSQEPFYRFPASLGIVIRYNAYTTTATITASAAWFTNAMIGSQLSIGGRQATITAVGSATPITTCTVTIPAKQSLPPRVFVVVDAFNVNSAIPVYPLNTIVETSVVKILGEVGAVTYAPGGSGYQWFVEFTLLTGAGAPVVQYESLVSAWGFMRIVEAGGPGDSKIGKVEYSSNMFDMITWTQDFMNAANGWPRACFYAHSRLGFCDFPQRPDAVLMSATGIYDVFWVDAAAALVNPNAGVNADTAILAFVSGQPHVRNVVEWNGDVFIFTDKGIYYIPVGTSKEPLSPGTISFTLISNATASGVKPVGTRDALVFTSASGDRVSSVAKTSNSSTTVYVEQDLSSFHSKLFNNPVTMAIGRGDEGFPERYIYVLNADGSVAVGRMQEDRSFVGWLPWTGAGSVTWISQGLLDILFVTQYGALFITEDQNSSYFLDHAVSVNSPPAFMLVSGKGAFFAFANGTVRVMDGAIDYGDRNVDANGFLVPRPEDDFSSPTVVAGQKFISVLSPFMPEAPDGGAQMQRQRLRKVARWAVAVVNSNGFTFGGRTIPPFDFDANPFAQPALKDQTYRCRKLGRSHDPTVELIKDSPGPLTIIESALEVTV